MLFNIYMRPLGGVIRECGALCNQYADDTQLYISFSPTAVDAVLSLQRCLESVLQWMQENGMRLNLDKTEVLRVGTPTVGGLGDSLSLGGSPLPQRVGSAVWGSIWTLRSPRRPRWRQWSAPPFFISGG